MASIFEAVVRTLSSGYDKAQVMAGDHPELPLVF